MGFDWVVAIDSGLLTLDGGPSQSELGVGAVIDESFDRSAENGDRASDLDRASNSKLDRAFPLPPT